MTQDDLQPGRMDTHPNVRCDWYDDGVREAGFWCTACDWVATVYADPSSGPEDVREVACALHDDGLSGTPGDRPV